MNKWISVLVCLFFSYMVFNVLEGFWPVLSFSDLGKEGFATSNGASGFPALTWSKSFLKLVHSDPGVRSLEEQIHV